MIDCRIGLKPPIVPSIVPHCKRKLNKNGPFLFHFCSKKSFLFHSCSSSVVCRIGTLSFLFHSCSFELSANIILLPRRNQYILIVRNIRHSLFSQLFSFLFHFCSNPDSIPIHVCSILVPFLRHICSILVPFLFTCIYICTKEI